ncbi:MAG: cell division protein FtsH, partial [Acidimicrobiia bacterium]|nr:cell division protein FtsH [Acidimicrobiia bacterium]
QEVRCKELLTTNRKALNLVARGLLEHETLSGDEVRRLINVASGHDTVTAPASAAAGTDSAPTDPVDTVSGPWGTNS